MLPVTDQDVPPTNGDPTSTEMRQLMPGWTASDYHEGNSGHSPAQTSPLWEANPSAFIDAGLPSYWTNIPDMDHDQSTSQITEGLPTGSVMEESAIMWEDYIAQFQG
jgi:hypothetical protein